jgi:hypothetical protein
VQSEIIGVIDEIQIEASSAIALALDNQLWQLLQDWIRLVKSDILPTVEQLPRVHYTYSTPLGVWSVRIVQGRDVTRNAFAAQVWLRNGGQTRFMGIFAYREGAVYNIDIKHLDARFAWWAMRLTGELEDDA